MHYLLLGDTSQATENNSAFFFELFLNLTELKYPNKEDEFTVLSLAKNTKSVVVGAGVSADISHSKVAVRETGL